MDCMLHCLAMHYIVACHSDHRKMSFIPTLPELSEGLPVLENKPPTTIYTIVYRLREDDDPFQTDVYSYVDKKEANIKYYSIVKGMCLGERCARETYQDEEIAKWLANPDYDNLIEVDAGHKYHHYQLNMYVSQLIEESKLTAANPSRNV